MIGKTHIQLCPLCKGTGFQPPVWDATTTAIVCTLCRGTRYVRIDTRSDSRIDETRTVWPG